MEQLSESTLALQSALEALPLEAGYSVAVETLAIATKTATNIARQVGLGFKWFLKSLSQGLHGTLSSRLRPRRPPTSRARWAA
jgi:hypothetical protein